MNSVTTRYLAIAISAMSLLGFEVQAADDGSQLTSPFRINYLGYFRDGAKLALYLSDKPGSKAWSLVDASGQALATGTSSDHVGADFASGDSFFRIDFSSAQAVGTSFRLKIDGALSEPFDITRGTPYGTLGRESFDYFKDHRTPSFTFSQFLNDWGKGSITGGFWNDAGDKGFYPTNSALASWMLMNLYERHPEANTSFGTGVSLYDELRFGADLVRKLILPGQKLAIAKLHTNVPAWGPCPPYTSGPGCISKPETKSTFAVARTLAQLARLHLRENQAEAARTDFALAATALANANTEPRVCLGFADFGGEGGIYPDNDTYGIWRHPKKFRDPCHPGRDNVDDDAYAALVEVFLAANALGDPSASTLSKRVAADARFGEISEFWWGAVTTGGNLSLLTLKPKGLELTPIRTNLFRYAERCIAQMAVGYPGVTKEVRSNRWDSGDQDDIDNNWRWGSNRLILDDGILLAIAAEELQASGDPKGAARYARHALRTMDYLLGTNAMALSMVTGFGEHAVERLHDCCVPNSEPGQLALGPNNWTNADDPDMPAFGSLPGMKMMPLKGQGWAAREVAIDGNAPLVWMAWWAEHRAPQLLDLTRARAARHD